MDYSQPFGAPPNAPFVEGNPQTGTPGSIPSRGSFEFPQRELVHLLTYAEAKKPGAVGTPTNNDLQQVRKAIEALISSGTRQRLQADMTIFVRTDGNDANTGFTNTAQGAKATIQGAWNAVKYLYDLSGYKLHIVLGNPGTYVGAEFKGFMGGEVILRGNTSVSTDYDIDPPAVNPYLAAPRTITTFMQNLTLLNVNVRRTMASQIGIAALEGSGVTLRDMAFEHANASTTGTDLYIAGNASVYTYGAIDLRTDGPARTMVTFLSCQNGGIFGGSLVQDPTTITNTSRTYSDSFVNCNAGLVVFLSNSYTFLGAATGPRFAVVGNGVIQTGGSGPSYLPGTVAGLETTGGRYL